MCINFIIILLPICIYHSVAVPEPTEDRSAGMYDIIMYPWHP